jgi:hypothetical protein
VLQDVADENVLPPQVNGGENLGKKLPGLADERPSRGIFACSRSLAHANQLGVRVSLTWNGIGRRRVEGAAGALRDDLGELPERAKVRNRRGK